MSYLKTLPRNEDGEYVMPNGTEWPTAEEAMISFLFDSPLCGTGCPDRVLLVVRDALRLSRASFGDPGECSARVGLDEQRRMHLALFGDTDTFPPGATDSDPVADRRLGLEFVLWYTLERKDLLDYGGNVGAAWITSLGKSVLDDLEAMGLDGAEADE